MLRYMLRMRIGRTHLLWLAILLTLTTGCSRPLPIQPITPPVVAGLAAANLPPEVRGRVLLGELGCTACHAATDAAIEHRNGPNLIHVGQRSERNYLQGFVLAPHMLKPGTSMPNLLANNDPDDGRTIATEITHYLQSFSSSGPRHTPVDPSAARSGGQLFADIGCQACHEPGRLQLTHFLKNSTDTLQAFLLAPQATRPAHRMPNIELSPAEARDLAHFLMENAVATNRAPQPTNAVKVTAGRQHFASLGCANCHALPDNQRPASTQSQPLATVDANGGCLSGERGAWPQYGLTDSQRDDIRLALTTIAQPLAGEARIQQLMASRNCFACHTRGDVDAVTQHQDVFTTNAPSIGQDGRLPPTLTGVGGKLQADWLQNAIAHGQQERPYLRTRMPGFGDEFAAKLTPLLIAQDERSTFAVTPLPKDRKEAEKITKVGQELIGDKGMNCISCHLFAGEQAGAMAAMDLVNSTGMRLTPEWFSAFLRNPVQYKPITLMPHFFPDDKSTRPQFCEGDTTKQIDAMWHYLAKGRNVRKPRGISRPSIKLQVDKEAVMLRRSVQNTGKRGISVGYPGGVNITFDAENLGLNQIWWGEFVDARPVWTGQGSGQAHILSKKRVTLPNGPAFAAFDQSKAPWPTATRRERGDRFLGYDLDAQQRPTFRYTAGDVTIIDTPREAIDDQGKTYLVRTIAIRADTAYVHFRAAVHKNIQLIDDRTVQVGKTLRIRCDMPNIVEIPGQEEKELLYLTWSKGEWAPFDIEYHWLEEGK